MSDEVNGNELVVNENETVSSEIVEVEHADIRQKVLELKDKADESYWELGIVLNDVYNNDYYRNWGFETWKDYVEQELDFGIRTAQYFLKIQKWFETMTPAMQSWLRSLGWTKCRMLLAVVTPENAKSWKNKIKGKSVRELDGIINRAKKGEDDSSGNESSGSESNDKSVSKESLVRRAFSLYSGQDEVVMNAINRAKDIGETDKDGHALSLICTDYLASSTDLIDIVSLFKHIEDITGHKIIAIKPVDGGDEVVFGYEYIEAMSESDMDNKKPNSDEE